MTSGAIVARVPKEVCYPISSFVGTSFEKPRSAILRIPLWINMLAGFRSLWMIPFLCISWISKWSYPESQNDFLEKSYSIAFLESSSPFDQIFQSSSITVFHDKYLALFVGIWSIKLDDEGTFAFPHVFLLGPHVSFCLFTELLPFVFFLHLLQINNLHCKLPLIFCVKHIENPSKWSLANLFKYFKLPEPYFFMLVSW